MPSKLQKTAKATKKAQFPALSQPVGRKNSPKIACTGITMAVRKTVTGALRFKIEFVPRNRHMTSTYFKSILLENQVVVFKCKHKVLFLETWFKDKQYIFEPRLMNI